MVLTITRIALLLFLSIIVMMLAAYSTTAKARIKRTSLVYFIAAGFLIASDGNLILGIIEAIIFLVIMLFSAIACLYAYAGTEIKQKSPTDNHNNTASENCTTLITIPFKKSEAEVTMDTVCLMGNLAFNVFCVCVGTLMVIRPTLLFPFYGKNPVLFVVVLIIVVINYWIASTTGKSTRATENFDSSHGEAVTIAIMIAVVVYALVQFFSFIAYSLATDKALENATLSVIPRSYGKMLPINELYHFELPSYMKHKWQEIDDGIYLIEDTSYSDRTYYCNLYGLGFHEIKDNRNNCEVVIHLIEEDGAMPHIDIYDSYYTNPKGEEDIASTLYSIYIKKEQILTY